MALTNLTTQFLINESNDAWNETKELLLDGNNYDNTSSDAPIDASVWKSLFDYLELSVINPYCRCTLLFNMMNGDLSAMVHVDYLEPKVLKTIGAYVETLTALIDLYEATQFNNQWHPIRYVYDFKENKKS